MRLVLKALGPEDHRRAAGVLLDDHRRAVPAVVAAACRSSTPPSRPRPRRRSGITAALDVRGDTETTVLAWAGDGGTFDIGLQALSGAAERNEDILYVCYDNEAYMNTGIQRSSATPWGAWTTTTPAGTPKSHPKKDILAIMAAHRIPYAATATVAYPDDLVAKVQKAKAIHGHALPAHPLALPAGLEDAGRRDHRAGAPWRCSTPRVPAVRGRGRRALALHDGPPGRAGRSPTSAGRGASAT